MKYFDIKNVSPEGFTDVNPDTTPEKAGYDDYGCYDDGVTLSKGSKILVVNSYKIEDIIIVKDAAIIKEYDASTCFVTIECGDEMVLVGEEASIVTKDNFDDYLEDKAKDDIEKEGYDLIILHM